VDQTAAVSKLEVTDLVDGRTGEVKGRRTKIEMYDKLGALRQLAQQFGLLTEVHRHEVSIEARVLGMSVTEREEVVKEIMGRARGLLAGYEAAVGRGEVIEAEGEAAGGEARGEGAVE
jgi:hypothetical protein